MFQFSTTHVLNDLKDVVGLKFSSGTVTKYDATSPSGAAINTKPSGWTDKQFERFKNVPDKIQLTVGKKNIFDQDTVKSIKLNQYTEGEPAKASITFTAAKPSDNKLVENCGRLFVYVTNPIGADPLFANDTKVKGKPFYVEFKFDANNANTTAQNLADAINGASRQDLVYDEGPVFSATVSGAVVTLEINGDLNKTLLDFGEIKVEYLQYDASGYYADSQFVKFEGGVTTAVTHIVPAFGTADYILHNLRLPTNANAKFFGDQWDEMPIKGKNYDQFIITVYTERPEVQGMSAVGQIVGSKTTHILWVNSDYTTNLLAIINKTIALPQTVTKDTINVKYTATTAASYNADLTDAVETGDDAPVNYETKVGSPAANPSALTDEEADLYNATLDGAVKAGDVSDDAHRDPYTGPIF